MSKIWDPLIPERDRAASRLAGFGRPSGLGRRPALLIIDVQYRTAGTRPMPFEQAVQEFATSCGDTAWRAIEHIAGLLALFRAKNWPVLYPHVAPKFGFDQGRLTEKVPTMMQIPAKGYEFVEAIAPRPGDVLLPKKHPSAFFGTPGQLSGQYRRRHAGGDGLRDVGLCPQQRGGRVFLQLPGGRSFGCGLRPEPGFACRQPVRHGGEVRGRDGYHDIAGGARRLAPAAAEEEAK